jgi:hypothetical protein
MPGVSRIRMGSTTLLMTQLERTPEVNEVSDSAESEVLKASEEFRREFPVELFPVPVTPIKQIVLYFYASCSIVSFSKSSALNVLVSLGGNLMNSFNFLKSKEGVCC